MSESEKMGGENERPKKLFYPLLNGSIVGIYTVVRQGVIPSIEREEKDENYCY